MLTAFLQLYPLRLIGLQHRLLHGQQAAGVPNSPLRVRVSPVKVTAPHTQISSERVGAPDGVIRWLKIMEMPWAYY